MDWDVNLRSVAVEPLPTAATAEPPPEHPRFALNVVFTTWRGTLAAVRIASRLSGSLGARILIWYFQTVPSQFSPSSPPVSTEFVKRRLGAMVRMCGRRSEAEIHICFCTDQRRCMQAVFAPESVVIAGGRRRWWSSREEKTAALLQSYGCRVLFVTDRPKPRDPSAKKEP
jgi:hypothetical protein